MLTVSNLRLVPVVKSSGPFSQKLAGIARLGNAKVTHLQIPTAGNEEVATLVGRAQIRMLLTLSPDPASLSQYIPI